VKTTDDFDDFLKNFSDEKLNNWIIMDDKRLFESRKDEIKQWISKTEYTGLNTDVDNEIEWSGELAKIKQWLTETESVYISIALDQTSTPKFAPYIKLYKNYQFLDIIPEKEWYLYRTHNKCLEACIIHSVMYIENRIDVLKKAYERKQFED